MVGVGRVPSLKPTPPKTIPPCPGDPCPPALVVVVVGEEEVGKGGPSTLPSGEEAAMEKEEH